MTDLNLLKRQVLNDLIVALGNEQISQSHSLFSALTNFETPHSYDTLLDTVRKFIGTFKQLLPEPAKLAKQYLFILGLEKCGITGDVRSNFVLELAPLISNGFFKHSPEERAQELNGLRENENFLKLFADNRDMAKQFLRAVCPSPAAQNILNQHRLGQHFLQNARVQVDPPAQRERLQHLIRFLNEFVRASQREWQAGRQFAARAGIPAQRPEAILSATEVFQGAFNGNLPEALEDFRCCILKTIIVGQVVKVPVVRGEGIYYADYGAITKLIRDGKPNPITREPLSLEKLADADVTTSYRQNVLSTLKEEMLKLGEPLDKVTTALDAFAIQLQWPKLASAPSVAQAGPANQPAASPPPPAERPASPFN